MEKWFFWGYFIEAKHSLEKYRKRKQSWAPYWLQIVSVDLSSFHNDTNKPKWRSAPPLWGGCAILVTRPTSLRAVGDLMMDRIIGLALLRRHRRVTWAVTLSHWLIYSALLTSEFDCKTLGKKSLCHLVLVVEESVDARSGAGIPDLHTLVRRAESIRLERAFFFIKCWCHSVHVCAASITLCLESVTDFFRFTPQICR